MSRLVAVIGAAALAAWQSFDQVPCVLEALVPLDLEVSVVLTRGVDGSVCAFPVAENQHTHGILDVSMVPARISSALTTQAVQIAATIAAQLSYVGTLGVELFVSNGRLLLNEIAPRPHNSGHYTIDACAVDQFEQQVRALCALPLAQPQLLSPAVMVNLLGDIWPTAASPDWAQVVATLARLTLERASVCGSSECAVWQSTQVAAFISPAATFFPWTLVLYSSS